MSPWRTMNRLLHAALMKMAVRRASLGSGAVRIWWPGRIAAVALGLLFLSGMPGLLAEEKKLSVEEGKGVLQTSLDRREREHALMALRSAGEAAAPAATLLGTIIAANPRGHEAGYAWGTLKEIGRPSIPLYAKLIRNGFDYAVVAGNMIEMLPAEAEPELLAALQPLLDDRETEFHALIALRKFRLSGEPANALALKMLEGDADRPDGPSCLWIAPRCTSYAVLEAMEKGRAYTAQFLAARLRETWRRRDSKAYQEHVRNHAPTPLAPEEKRLCDEADARIAGLARQALPEVLKTLRTRSGNMVFFPLEVLEAISKEIPLPREETAKVLDDVVRDRGSLIDGRLIQYRGWVAKYGKMRPY